MEYQNIQELTIDLKGIESGFFNNRDRIRFEKKTILRYERA